MGNFRGSNFLVDIFQQQKQSLAARLTRFLLNPHDIEDILQETFILAHGVEKKHKIENPPAYLYTIARNLAIKTIRSDSKKLTQEIENIDDRYLVSDEPSSADKIFYKNAYQSLCDSIDHLPPQCQKVFVLRKIYGFSQKEIAAKLNISRATVERHITEATKRCRRSLERNGYDLAEDQYSVRNKNRDSK